MPISSTVWIRALLVVGGLARAAVGQTPAEPTAPPPAASPPALTSPSADAAPQIAPDNEEDAPDWDKPVQDSASAREFIRALAASHLPQKYENNKQWGKKRRVTTGVKVSLDGLRVDSERRVKEVNDGSWKRYRIDRKPGDDSLELAVERVEQQIGRAHV